MKRVISSHPSLNKKSVFAPFKPRVGKNPISMWHDGQDSHRVSIRIGEPDAKGSATPLLQEESKCSRGWRECLDISKSSDQHIEMSLGA